MKDNTLLQRLVGASVLIALVVIFVPMLLEGGDESTITGTNIPEQPATTFNSRITPLDEPLPEPELLPDSPPVSDEAPVIVERDTGEPLTPQAGEDSADANQPPQLAPIPGASETESVADLDTDAAEPTALLKPDEPPTAETSAADIPQEMAKSSRGRMLVTPWVVQIGSFSSQKNALTLRDQLRSKGYTTFVEAITHEGKKIFRVRVGPELDRAEAEAIRERLDKELKIKGILTRYVS